MKGSSYRDRDYAFGQAMLTLRITIGLTQAELAKHLDVSRKAVGEWEAGLTYPKAEHLKAFIALAVEQQAFPAGREEEEVRTFWQAAHQKVLLDKAWLAALLPHAEVLSVSQPTGETIGTTSVLTPPAGGGPRVDWGDAPAVTTFYGREWELNLLTSWIVQERCRVVSVLGLGGIGKSALATRVMHRVAERFEVVIWRSLRDAPACEGLLDECLQVLAPQALRDVSVSLERRLDLLLEHLRRTRVLLVFDNLEALLEEGEGTGHMRPGYEGFARLLRRMAETEQQSCLLLTSREKSGDLVPLEGSRAPVRTLRLARLDADSCKQLLAEKDVAGSAAEQARLIEAYAGNPLALKIVAQTIVELFDGEIAPFLKQGEVVFGGVRELLGEQYARLADLERTLVRWLAIVREPVSIEELLALLGVPLSRSQMLEAVDGLRRRSLIERGQLQGSFTLQSVVLEYVTAQLIEEVTSEIEQGRLIHLIEHGLELTTAKEYVRQTQERLIVTPLLVQLRKVFRGRAEVEGRLLALLDQLRTQADDAQGYGPANVLALLRELRGHLRGLDLSHLSIRGAYLHGVEMQDASLAETSLRETIFNEAFDITWAVAISRNGQYWAAGSRRGEARVWREEGKLLHLAWQAHTDTVRALAFSPDGRTLATGSWDGSIKLWDIESGGLLWTSWFTDNIECLTFAPDGRTLASGGDDATVQLWDATSGAHRQTLSGQSGPVFALAWSPDGRFLASSGLDNAVRLWDATTGEARQVLQDPDHANTLFFGVAWSPDGSRLASASYQQGVQVWEVATGIRRWVGYAQPTRIRRVAWSPDGTQLASCGDDGSVCLWEATDGRLRASLPGHRGMVMSVAWSPDGARLASAGGGRGSGEIFIWDVQSGERLQGWNEPNGIVDALAWSPTGEVLLSGSSDGSLRWWDVQHGKCLALRQGHQGAVQSLRASPDGRRLASCGDDNIIQVWNPQSGEHLRMLRRDRPYERLNISGVKGLTGAQKTTLRALGAIEDVPAPGTQRAP